VTRRSTLQARHRRTADQQAITEIVMSSVGKTGLQLRSLIKASGELEISLADVLTPEPRPDLVRIEATPINPSDLGLLTGAADFSTIKASGTKDHPIISAKVPEAAMPAMAKWPKASSGSGSPIRC
jgi:hypothetical protein